MFPVFLSFLFFFAFFQTGGADRFTTCLVGGSPSGGAFHKIRREHSILYIIFFLFAANARLDDSEVNDASPPFFIKAINSINSFKFEIYGSGLGQCIEWDAINIK